MKSSQAFIPQWETIISRHCYLCMQARDYPRTSYMCSGCLKELRKIDHGCAICGDSLASSVALHCANCQKSTPYFDQCISAFNYEAEVKHMLRAFKFHENFYFGKACSLELYKTLENNFKTSPKPDVILCVPLHKKRYKQRRFNQAEFIAHFLHKKLSIPFAKAALTRDIETIEQHSLNKNKRRKNVKNAFSLHAHVEGKHIALVDDVVTTGSTVNIISALLKKNGATHIDVWSIARTTKD